MINIFGTRVTVDEAKEYLKRLKAETRKNIDKDSFIFDDQELYMPFVKYFIEYLENETGVPKDKDRQVPRKTAPVSKKTKPKIKTKI